MTAQTTAVTDPTLWCPACGEEKFAQHAFCGGRLCESAPENRWNKHQFLTNAARVYNFQKNRRL
jgi:hypothetical protein